MGVSQTKVEQVGSKFVRTLGDKDENYTEVIFPNDISENFTIAQNNFAALEMQRKQIAE